jgi:hypothetical protein
MKTRPTSTSTSLRAFATDLQRLQGEALAAAKEAIAEETRATTADIFDACPVGSDYTYRTTPKGGTEKTVVQKHKGGTLRTTVKAEISDDGLTGFAKVGGKKAPYAHLVEFGHKKAGGGTVAGRPFVTPAGERGRARLAPRLAAILREGLK